MPRAPVVEPARVERVVRLTARALGAQGAVMWSVTGDVIAAWVSPGAPLDPSGAAPPTVTDVDGPVLIDDVRSDPRWSSLAPAVGACAITPVLGSRRQRLGVLVVLDPTPRGWSLADAETLAEHASLAGDMLDREPPATDWSGSWRAVNEQLARNLANCRQAEGVYRALAKNVPNGAVFLFDHDLRYLLADGVALERAGRAGIEGRTLAEVLGAEERARLEPLYRSALDGDTTSSELTFSGRTYLIHALPVRGEDGAVVAGMIVAQETTAHVAAEAALRASEARYRLLFERAAEAIYIIAAEEGAAGRILEANPRAAALHGYALEEMMQLKLQDVLAPDDPTDVRAVFARVLDGEWIEGRTVHVRRDGTRFPVEYLAGPLDVGGRRMVATFSRDITERERVEEALRQAKDAADQASRAKSAFLANMSHEIRTPMNAVLGYAQLLQRDPALTREQKRHLGVIIRSGEHLLELINDVLEMSKIEIGFRKVHRTDVDVRAFFDDLERMFRVRTDAKSLAFAIVRSAELPRYVVADEGKLRQVLVNLLSNAVKFTERGSVSVRVRVDRADGEHRLVVEIADTGPGIAPDELKALFRPFVQTRVGIHARGGTGLGLAISREFARLMGGDIAVESRVLEGSTFRLAIPVEIGRAPLPSRLPPKGRVVSLADVEHRVRILVVDDSEDDRSWVRQLLAQVGFEVREASDGAEGLAVFEEWRPHLVLLDMNMPVMDGYAAARAMRSRPAGRKAVIVAATASAFDEERDAIVEAGADGVLHKPCRETDLLEEIRKQLGIEYTYGAEVAPDFERTSQLPMLTLRPEAHIRKLPPALVEGLREAARVADYERLLSLLTEVPSELGAIGEALRELVERYDYEALGRVLGG